MWLRYKPDPVKFEQMLKEDKDFQDHLVHYLDSIISKEEPALRSGMWRCWFELYGSHIIFLVLFEETSLPGPIKDIPITPLYAPDKGNHD